MSKFWGLTVNTGKKFKQQVQESFCISGAALEPLDLPNGKFDEKPVLLYLQQDQNDFLLCSLSSKQSVLQTTLNVRIGNGETVGFHLKGGSPKSKVHLVGYTLPAHGENLNLSSSSESLQRKGILVTEPKSADKQKKRVSIVENESYGEREPLDSDEDNEITGDDSAESDASKKLFNGLGEESESDEDDDNDDEIEDDDSDEPLNEAEYKELQQMLQKGRFNPQTGGKLGDDEDSDGLEMLDEDDDDDDEEEEEDEEEDSDELEPIPVMVKRKKNQIKKSPNSQQQSPANQKQAESDSSTPTSKERKGETQNSNKANPSKTPENKNLSKVKTPSSAGHTPMKSFSKGGVLVNDVKAGNGQIAKLGKMVGRM